MTANDFLELCIAAEETPTDQSKATLQTLVTKLPNSPTTKGMAYQEVCQRLIRQLEVDKRAVRFVLKQFCYDTRNQESQSGNLNRAYAELQEEFTQFQQKNASERLKNDQAINDLQLKSQTLSKQLEEANTQLEQFRQYHAAQGMARLPSSAHSHSSAGSVGKTPPMSSFLQKQAREKVARENAGRQSRNPLGNLPNMPGHITPMQVPPSNHSRGPNTFSFSNSGRHSMGHSSSGHHSGGGRHHHSSSHRPYSSRGPSSYNYQLGRR